MLDIKFKAFVIFALAASSFAPPAASAQESAAARQKPVTPAQAPTSEEFYSCPMHPEVKGEKAGRCPKCGMDLRLARAASPAAATVGKVAPAGQKMSIPDVEVLDQDGRALRFYSDLVKGRVVVINFIFTTCTTVCPPLGATFARVQKELGERAGRDVHFISVSVDPATDTPERLKAWGAKFKAGPSWTFVTGSKPEVDELLRALAASSARPEDHTPTVLIGNDARNQWTRSYGLARPSQLVQLINDAAEGRLGGDKQEDAKR